jgi:hypothetical protein
VNLQAFSLSFFWQDCKVKTTSFADLGASIGNLSKLKYLSLSQSLLYTENYQLFEDDIGDALFERLTQGCPLLRDVYLGYFYAVTPLTWQLFSQNCPNLRSMSIEDCGVALTAEVMAALTGMSARANGLRYLTLLPRSPGNVSAFVPAKKQAYVTAGAMDTLVNFLDLNSGLTVFMKLDADVDTSYASDIISSSSSKTALLPAAAAAAAAAAETDASTNFKSENKKSIILIDQPHPGASLYDSLVCRGHIAAFRMHALHQLLPTRYFVEDKQ